MHHLSVNQNLKNSAEAAHLSALQFGALLPSRSLYHSFGRKISKRFAGTAHVSLDKMLGLSINDENLALEDLSISMRLTLDASTPTRMNS
jgi:hypothetical protein